MSNGGDFGNCDLDPSERRDAQVYLDDPEAGDDEPWSPPDRQPRAGEFVDSDSERETIDQRLGQEEPEEGTDYGAPREDADDEQREWEGGDDPDAIPADQDFVGDPDEYEDLDNRDPNAPAEVSAMHLADEQGPDETGEDSDWDEDSED